MPEAGLLTSLTGLPLPESTLAVIGAGLVLGFEMRHFTRGLCGPGTFKRYTPEAVGLSLMAAVSIGLRLKGPTDKPLDDEAWAEITRDWPVLMTADTLLAIQAMLRFLIFNSAVLRSERGRQGMERLPAALFFLAIATRAGLFAYHEAYRLDGPIGGKLAAGFEVATLLPLLALVLTGAWTRLGAGFLLITVAASVYVAMNNHLSLAQDLAADGAFACAHALELGAAAMHLVHAGRGASSPGGGIVSLLMPLQQVFPAYYFLEAFEPLPQLVGKGRPFELLWGGAVAQLGIYLCAGAVYLACLAEGVTDPSVQVGCREGDSHQSEPMPALSKTIF